MGKIGGVVIMIVILLVFLFLSGGKTTAPSQSGVPTPAAPTTGFSAALVTPGAINDGGWSQNAYQGLQKIKQELGAKISNTVAGSPTEAFAAFRDYAGQKTDLIIGHASEWYDPETLKIAAAHPQSTFLISGSENARDNVIGVRFLLEDSCYVLGFIAGAMSKSGVLGCVGPMELPVIASTFHAFAEGAKAARPDIVVMIVWTNDWADVARAKERTLILIEKGADFIFHNANDGGPGVFQAAQEKKEKGVLVFGSNADQNGMAADVILASAVLDVPSAFLSLARKKQSGGITSEAQFLGMPEGFTWVAYNPKLEARIPADVRQRADAAAEQIKKRELKVPRLELKAK